MVEGDRRSSGRTDRVRRGDAERATGLFAAVAKANRAASGIETPRFASSAAEAAVAGAAAGDLASMRELLTDAEAGSRRWIERAAAAQASAKQSLSLRQARGVVDSLIALEIAEQSKRPDAVPRIAELLWRWKGIVTLRQRADRIAGRNPELRPLLARLRRANQAYAAAPSNLPADRREMLEAAREAAERELSARSVAYREAVAVPTVEQVAARLPARSALVDVIGYLDLPDGVPANLWKPRTRRYLFLVVRSDGAASVFAFRNDAASAIDGLVREFRRAIADRDRVAADRAGATLRGKVWQPIDGFLAEADEPVETLFFSPDGELCGLPLAALPGRRPGGFLIEDHRVATVPFARLAFAGEAPLDTEREAAGGLLVVGDVDYGTAADAEPDWKPLPGLAAEAGEVARRFEAEFPGRPLRSLSGEAAREDRVLAALPEAGIVHLATHGYFEATGASDGSRSRSGGVAGLRSGLVFAGANRGVAGSGDGILRALEIEALSLPATELVVLSACETGLGSTTAGEGLMGLQRAFQIAGAEGVVASLWKVDDAATRLLMRRFSRNLWQEKLPPAEALRRAQLSLIREPAALLAAGVARPRGVRKLKPREVSEPSADVAGETTDPYFWAAFQFSGGIR